MSYLDGGNGKQRVNAALGVGALHFMLGAGLLIGLAVKVAPDRAPDPIVVRLDPVKPQPKPEPLPMPQPRLSDIRVQADEPVIEYREPQDTPLVAGAVVPPVTGEGQPGSGNGQTAKPEVLPAQPVRRAALARPGTVALRPEDYPDASRRAGEEGRVTIRVGIGTDGSVSNCTVIASSGHERLDRKTCQVAERRWRFSPATEDGVAVPSSAERSIVWRLEDLR
ncbi:energy transducer TonB [Sandaracinobacter neustonicus]|uniref:Protein TonB n=1 Tax=Sandaracinobacter neustonicus TaxID=1715348 RepID=A0A501XL51_9SPHN|nr:energy transducer TonB [Sandaracinobacter neustonicus]TPE61004.1 energy transducer TonB [Sandaracinobacter neustonicus]